MNNIVGYARVSTKDQCLETQIEQIQAYTKVRSLNLLNIYTDKATGSNTGRIGYQNMIDALDKNPLGIEGVVVTKIDRLGRSLRDLLFFVDLLKGKNIQFISISDNIDTSSPGGVLFLHMMGCLSEFERALILERTSVGRNRYISNGGKMGAPIKVVPKDEIIKLLNEGVPKKRIARKYNVSVNTLKTRLQEWGYISESHDIIKKIQAGKAKTEKYLSYITELEKKLMVFENNKLAVLEK